MCYHYRCHEQDSGKAHYLLSEQVVFHGAYLALVRLPIASMPPAHDARCTVPGIVCAEHCPWAASVDGGEGATLNFSVTSSTFDNHGGQVKRPDYAIIGAMICL